MIPYSRGAYDEKFILDACCSARMFWFNKKHPNVLYIDIREEPPGLCPEQPNFEIKPDFLMDFRKMDFPDKRFRMVVWDPLHMKGLNASSIYAKKFGTLNAETWQFDLSQGFKECWRVLDDYGVLIFKWNEEHIELKKVLSLFKREPLFGHTTGSKSKTHWICWMKIPESQISAEYVGKE